MDLMEKLAQERRARLAAERLLEQRTRELYAANEKLALHARALSDQIVEQRQVVHSVRSEAELLKGQNSRYLQELDRAHTAAVMAEQRLRVSINTIRDGFAVFDAGLRLVMANDAFLAFFPGLGPGTPYDQMIRFAAETGMVDGQGEAAEDWITRLCDRISAERLSPETVRLSTGRWIKLIDRRARDGDMVCLILDITEQMRIWAAIEALPDAFVLFDREERLLTCNQRYRDLFPESADVIEPGTSFESLLRHGLEKGQIPEAVGHEDGWLARRLRQFREAKESSESQLASGRWILESDHVTPDGGRVGLRIDITQIREQQRALDAARLQAEAANRAKSAFLANMSHEIRTPMNGVVGMAELLCDTSLSEEQRLFAETIRSSGEALLVIINDILDYSKLEAERMAIHPEPFDLEHTIHEVTMLLQPRARAKGIDMMIDFDMFLPTRYVGDPVRLRQVLTNLIGNAVKFTDHGHVLTRVVGMEVEDGRQQLHVTVEDTGIGIDPGQLDHIFGEFNQVENEGNRRYEGTGLGLAITHRLIERMEGAVWVDSEPGKGSCFGFRVTLPLAEGAVPARQPINLRRALVVDDQFINRTILERQLVTCGMAVRLCRSGAEALAALAEDAAYDVLILDHMMPEMDGMDLAKAVRAAGHGLPMVMLSSNPSAARGQEAAAEITAFLQKPVLRADLFRRLAELSSGGVVLDAEPALPVAAPVLQRRMRVLAAEDNKTNQLVFQKMVKTIDIDLRFANNGLEAVEIWREFRPDLIFMDISMPQMDGRDAARAIRAEEAGRAHVPIVALTAHAMEGDGAEILAAGIDRYLTKPLRKAAITGALAEFCPAEVESIAGLGEDAA
ncbi:response regulator [Xinfangfangia sp. CPCC 101601]|uniref:histidine kinase n=1 Tax=Pseudogemmobacter lacusdianii TaxID=3069608 RepID=A0ABU0VXM0_9RHOB|nr:response regulator [Xinfangfangia sp. CPCC 101601]MDQ2066496.1 response regulator [Xinfangfangia sp. CPCC 101601]